MAWGKHAMFDIAGCDYALITSRENVANFARELVQKIDMKAYGEPDITHFGEPGSDKEGFTLIQKIETSNITGHFCNHTLEAYIDIFSCKSFNLKIAQNVVEKYFHPKSVRVNLITRQA